MTQILQILFVKFQSFRALKTFHLADAKHCVTISANPEALNFVCGNSDYLCIFANETILKKDMEMNNSTIVSEKKACRTQVQENIAKTPESELISVEEYFGLLRQRVNEHYDSLQG